MPCLIFDFCITQLCFLESSFMEAGIFICLFSVLEIVPALYKHSGNICWMSKSYMYICYILKIRKVKWLLYGNTLF
jgi:hypothetical protein